MNTQPTSKASCESFTRPAEDTASKALSDRTNAPSSPLRTFSASPSKLKRTLGQLILFRITILSLLLGTNAWNVLMNERSIRALYPMFWGIAITYGISLINALWLKFAVNVKRLGYCQALADVILATLVMYVTGGASSPLFVLYLFIIVGATVLFGSSGAVIVAAASGLLYALLASGLIAPLDLNSSSISAAGILGVYTSLIVIALASSYLAKQLEAVWRIADRHKQNLHELSNQQQQFFNDISDGILTIDIHSAITNINKAACAIMGLSDIDAQSLIGSNFSDFLKNQHADKNEKSLFETNISSNEPMDLNIRRKTDNKELCLDYTVRTLSNSLGSESGKLLCFRDVSHIRSMEKRLSLHEQITKLLAETDLFQTSQSPSTSPINLIGESKVMQQIIALIERVAAKEASVLITGESGTGKEVIAKAVHSQSPRCNNPFVAINCGAIPETLIESELFGYKKGAFTGANSNQLGLFRQADGGTIFLDEIGELPLQLQSKLLRVLQEKTVRPVGDVHDIPVDVRIISATNKDLKVEIANKRFREDLFYRLNVVNIVVPPLRNRKEDIPLLMRYFIGRYSDKSSILPKISAEAAGLLINYSFPGNVRELENIIERALVLGSEAILPEHLPDEVKLNSGINKANSAFAIAKTHNDDYTRIYSLPIDLENTIAELEKVYLLRALEQAGGIKKQAAKLLGLNFRAFRYRLKKYGMGDEATS